MKNKVLKRVISLLLTALMVVSIIPISLIEVEAQSLSVQYVTQRLEQLISQYRGTYWSQSGGPSSSWTGSKIYAGSYQCNGFAKMIFNEIFGTGSIGSYNAEGVGGYKKGSYYPTPRYAKELCRTKDVSVTNLKNLAQKGRPGDFIQYSWYNSSRGTYSQHSVILHSVTNTGLYVFDCNWDSKCGVQTHLLSFDWLRRNARGFSMYTSTKYEDIAPPKSPIPSIPSFNYISTNNAAQWSNITMTWPAVSGAESYTVAVRSNTYNQDINVGGSTSYVFKLAEAQKYDFYVRSNNSSGSSNWSSPVSCTSYKPSTVKFVDCDGTVLSVQMVAYGQNANPPVSPERQGYSFQGWEGSYYNITSDININATYRINTYTVKFLDKNGDVIGTPQKVTYGSSAVEPEDKNCPTGYKFVGWDSDLYKNVYTDASDKTIIINGIYEWENYDLPIVCTNQKANRQSDGYYINFDLVNYDKAITRGRAIVSLKTESGKLVEMTESSAFSIAAGKTKSMEVFVPCDVVATKAEIIVVNSYSSGVPVSESVACGIPGASDWTDWSETEPSNGNGTLEVETKTQYQYRDKELSTASTKTKTGWTFVKRTESVGNWSSWQDSYIQNTETESIRREVSTRTVQESYQQWGYVYYHFYKPNGGNHGWCPTNHAGGTYHGTYYAWDQFTWYKYSSCGSRDLYQGYACDQCGASQYWFYNSGDSGYVTRYRNKTQYQYRDIYYTYHFYRWLDWSDWSDTVYTATDNREVNTRTLYRYKSANAGTEDNTGVTKTITGKFSSDIVSNIADKQITLFVYRFDGASDYTNEFVGQYLGKDVMDEQGNYNFTFRLRQNPTAATGDYTVAIGIEGTNNIIVIDTIEAPKPVYTVTFHDINGNVISTQSIEHGEDATLPTTPEVEGYDFIGWDKSNANIKEDVEFYPNYEKQEITIVFVDWSNQLIKVQKYEYGAPILPPELEKVEGYDFVGWDALLNNELVATKDMIITAEYEKKSYKISFCDFDGEVIKEETVEYGGSAEAPELETEDNIVFVCWQNAEDYAVVDSDAYIYPMYYYTETAEVPSVNYENGEYSEPISLELTSDDANAVIYYSINDGEELIYNGPVTIDRTCSVTYHAESLAKNPSEYETRYYCINSAGTPSKWMIYEDLPEDVKANHSDYIFEEAQGYRFKDTMSVETKTAQSHLLSGGWKATGKLDVITSSWQDTKFEPNNDLIDFAIETQTVIDTTKTNYQYSHYKYTDASGKVVLSPVAVSGFDCTLEKIVLENKITDIEFMEDGTTMMFNYNGQQWFNQTKVNGTKTQYRTKYTSVEYYKWTDWEITAPGSGESREHESEKVYRYANKNHHIVTVVDENANVSYLLVEDGKNIDFSMFADVEGYDFFGLFTDADFKNQWTQEKTVRESCTLYSRYSPKSYTVVFQMQDGTEIDTQTVKYSESAVPPEAYKIKGHVFVGWDTDEYNCVTKDLVVSAKYVSEKEYARVEILGNETKPAYVGSMIQLVANITPAELSDSALTWSSSDDSVATVDENGMVKCISAGVATITVKVNSTNETDSCKIIVNVDNTVNLVLGPQSYLVVDSLGYIRGLKAATNTVEEVKSHFTNYTLEFYNFEGKLLNDYEKVGTGTVVKLVEGENVVDEQTFIMTGDVTGDGWYDGQDATIVACIAAGMLTVNDVGEAAYIAADCNYDGVIEQKDVELLNKAGALISNVDQNQPVEDLEEDEDFVTYASLIDQTADIEIEIDDSDNIPAEPDEEINTDPENGENTDEDSTQQDAKVDIWKMILNFIKSVFEMLLAHIPSPLK